MNAMNLSLEEALRMTLERITPLPAENVALVDSIDRVSASDLYAFVDSPPTDTSRKDGYAVVSHEVAGATAKNPVRLRVLGAMAAGGRDTIQITSGTTVRVSTGARIPPGANAVVAEEFVKKDHHEVLVENYAEPKNILPCGSDVASGDRILRTGQLISPVMAGLLAVAGYSKVPVFRNPLVGIIGTGDEIVEPGRPLDEGTLYASNIITLAGWCSRYKMKPFLAIVKDDPDAIFSTIRLLSAKTNAIITSGGAWTGDHDMVARVLGQLGWNEGFHRIRMGPGKAVGFGMLNEKPVFVLPGGPPSNVMAFLQIALPGLHALSGHADPGLPRIKARLASELADGEIGWTDFFFGTLTFDTGMPAFHPMQKRSRLASIAGATAIVSIPEEQDHLSEGSIVCVQLLK